MFRLKKKTEKYCNIWICFGDFQSAGFWENKTFKAPQSKIMKTTENENIT